MIEWSEQKIKVIRFLARDKKDDRMELNIIGGILTIALSLFV